MSDKETAAFFAEFCEENPMAARLLMTNMLQHPTGGVSITLPRLINMKDLDRFYRESEAVARKYIMRPEHE